MFWPWRRLAATRAPLSLKCPTLPLHTFTYYALEFTLAWPSLYHLIIRYKGIHTHVITGLLCHCHCWFCLNTVAFLLCFREGSYRYIINMLTFRTFRYILGIMEHVLPIYMYAYHKLLLAAVPSPPQHAWNVQLSHLQIWSYSLKLSWSETSPSTHTWPLIQRWEQRWPMTPTSMMGSLQNENDTWQ